MPNESATLWEVELAARPGRPDPEHRRAADSLRALAGVVNERFGTDLPEFQAVRGFLIETEAAQEKLAIAARSLLADPVVETATVRRIIDRELSPTTLTVMRKPGVMDPVASYAANTLRETVVGELSARQVTRSYISSGE